MKNSMVFCHKKIIKVFVCSLFLALTISAVTPSEKVDAYISTYERTNDFSGCVLIKKGQNVQYSNCFGKANFEFGVPNSSQTKFKIGSISKQFTAVGILLLEEKGLLKTEDFVSKHLPEYEQEKKIKIHHLLTHKSGLVDIYSLPNYREINRKSLSLKQVTDEIFKNKLLSEPGKTYAYSNSGYTVLARIIEKLSGKPYSEFLSENIFKPLKMNSTGDYFDNLVEENLAVGYDPKGYDRLTKPDYVNDVFFRGSGSLFSTIGDLAKWIEAVRDGKILNQNSRTKLLMNHNNNYGYGISVYKSFGKNVFGHDGRISGYIADYLHYREDNISVIILGNIQTGVADFLRRDIAAIIFEKEYKSRAKTILSKKTYPKNFKKLIGKYQFAPNFFVYIENFGGVLKARANEGSYSELVPLIDGRYFSRTLYSYIDFEFDEAKNPTKLIWINNDGNKFEGKRIQKQKDAATYFKKGKALQKKGQNNEAMKMFQKALAVDPKFKSAADALNELVNALNFAGRRVENNVLISKTLPNINVSVSDEFKYVGRFPFSIRDVAGGERFVFVDADKNKRVKRLFIAQFEGFFPHIDNYYRYTFTNALNFGGHKFRHNPYAYSNKVARKKNPNGEGTLTENFLKEKGYKLEDELMMYRYITVPDKEKKHELILFYLENASDSKYKLADFYKNNRSTEVWRNISKKLMQRSLKSFEIAGSN